MIIQWKHKCFPVIKNGIMDTVNYFYQYEVFQKRLYATHIALVPKRNYAEEFNDYKRISLVGGKYNIIAKTLIVRLKKVIGKLISGLWNAYILWPFGLR